MKRHFLSIIFVLACASASFAQGSGGYNKWDVNGGYSLGRITSNIRTSSFTSSSGTETFTDFCSAAAADQLGPNSQKFFCTRRNFNGFEASLTRNLSRYVGIQGDVTGHFKTQAFVDKFTPPGATQTEGNRERLWNFLGGVQIKNNSRDARLKPFGRALAGVARYTNRSSQTIDLFPQFNFVIDDRVTSFAMKLGGGLDIRAGKRIDIRVISVDFNPVFSRDRRAQRVSGPFDPVTIGGKTTHSFTIGAGIVIH
jgi:hypothetical protein